MQQEISARCRSVRWEDIPQSVTMAALIDLMRGHGFDYGGNVRSINWPFDRVSRNGSAIIRFETHEFAEKFKKIFNGYTWKESATKSRLEWSPERTDGLPEIWGKTPASEAVVIIKGLPSNCTYARLQKFLKRYYGPITRCRLGARDGHYFRQVVCTFATVGAARSALRSSKLASDGNRKCMRILRSFGGPISFEAHKEEEEEEVTESDASGAGKESNTTVLDSSGGEETTTAVEDDSSMGSSSPRVDEVGLLAIPDPPATLSWYNVPPIYTAEKLMRFFLDYGLHMGPLSPYRSCDVITDEHTSVALVHCASMQKARALQQALYEFPGLVGDHGSMKVTEGRRDTFFIDALPVCWGADASRTVVALNVPVNLSREKLIEIMAKFGDVSQVVVRSYLSCGRVTTYGLCRFVSRGSASFAAEISRIPITQQDCGYRTMLALLGQKARLKSLTWLMSNEWYFDMNRRRQQAWATTPLGYYYYPPMLPPSTTTMVEVPSVPLPPMEDAENEDGIWYERRPRFEKINDEVGKASTDSPPTDECLASNGVLRPLVFPPPQWRGGGYRKVNEEPLCTIMWPRHVRGSFL